MSILLLTEVFPPMHGGSGRWLYEVYRRVTDTPVTVVAGKHDGSQNFDAQCELPVHRSALKMSNWGILSLAAQRDYLREYRLLRGLIQEQGVREVHVGRCLPEGWLAWMLKHRMGIPYVCYVHGEDAEIARTSRQLFWMAQRVFRNAESIIAVCAASGDKPRCLPISHSRLNSISPSNSARS